MHTHTDEKRVKKGGSRCERAAVLDRTQAKSKQRKSDVLDPGLRTQVKGRKGCVVDVEGRIEFGGISEG